MARDNGVQQLSHFYANGVRKFQPRVPTLGIAGTKYLEYTEGVGQRLRRNFFR